jgi:hypothetical protein
VVCMTKTDPKLRLPLPHVLQRLKVFAERGETSPAQKKPELTLCGSAIRSLERNSPFAVDVELLWARRC